MTLIRRLSIIFFLGTLLVPLYAQESPVLAGRIEAWKDLRFGMFIHWGPVSLEGTEIGWSRGAQVPIAAYDALYTRFNPTLFDAQAWARIAKEAGMKYVVLTSKHHDGFCLWDTGLTDYNIMRTPFGRDVVKELSEACRKEGLAFGLYYSILDWHHPLYPTDSPHGKVSKKHPDMDGYERYLRGQLRELSENYGPLLTFWFDGQWESPWTPERGRSLLAFCRALDPGMLINNRVGKNREGGESAPSSNGRNPGDYDTPEQRIGAFDDQRPWETCMTLCTQWSWKPDDTMKSIEECIHTLLRTAGGDGNLLFNVGPMPDGRIEPRQAERLKEMGRWIREHGESLYGTRGGPFYPGDWGCSTHRGDTVYVHVFQWTGSQRLLPGLENKIVSASLLSGPPVKFNQAPDLITLTVPPSLQAPPDTIVVLKMEEPVTGTAKSEQVPTIFDLGKHGEWISKDAAYEMSSRAPLWSTHEARLLAGGDYGADFAFHTDEERNPYILIDLGKEAKIRGLHIVNRKNGFQERARSLAAWVSRDKQEWTLVWQAKEGAAEWTVLIDPPAPSARYIKLGLQHEEKGYFHLYSVKVYGNEGS